MTESAELLKKLQVKAGTKLWLVNVPQAIAEALTAGAEVEPVKHGDPCDGVIAFCETPAEVAAFSAQALEMLPEGGLTLETVERALLVKALAQARNNKSRAAKLLGLPRGQLYSLLRRHGLTEARR